MEKNLLIFGFCLSNLTRIFVKCASCKRKSRFSGSFEQGSPPQRQPGGAQIFALENALVIVYKRLTPLPNRKDQPVSRC